MQPVPAAAAGPAAARQLISETKKEGITKSVIKNCEERVHSSIPLFFEKFRSIQDVRSFLDTYIFCDASKMPKNNEFKLEEIEIVRREYQLFPYKQLLRDILDKELAELSGEELSAETEVRLFETSENAIDDLPPTPPKTQLELDEELARTVYNELNSVIHDKDLKNWRMM